jgi:Ca2+-binding EF-hand superfamily protein
MRTTFSLIFSLALITSVQADAPRAVPGDAQDLVMFLAERPYLIRLHLQINGRSFRQNWDETIENLFRYLDVNGDGALDEKEIALAPSKTQWVQLMTGISVEPDGPPDFPAGSDSPQKIRVTKSQFLQYYRDAGAGALQIEWGWCGGGPDALSEALFRHLDKDKDGSMSKEELSNAPAVLGSLDVNGDELIQVDELNPPNGALPNFTFRSAIENQSPPNALPFLVLPPDADSKTLAEELLRRHDGDTDHHLSRSEMPLGKSSFDRLDFDRDGKLSAAELAQWRKLTPDLEVFIPLDLGGSKEIRLVPAAGGRVDRLSVKLPPTKDGVVRVSLPQKQLELVRNSQSARIRRELLERFDALAGKDSVLTEKKAYQPPFTFVAMLRLADRNGDNRLTRKELVDYLDLQEKFLFRTTFLTVVDRGASLFEFIDADHDRRLSPRELRSVWSRLSAWDAGKSGRIARKEIPQQFQLLLSYGSSRAVSAEFTQGVSPFRDRSRGPLWFRKMDRNGDGDISQAEFLGTMEQFRRLDADGDGLIDLTEAERADESIRKRK